MTGKSLKRGTKIKTNKKMKQIKGSNKKVGGKPQKVSISHLNVTVRRKLEEGLNKLGDSIDISIVEERSILLLLELDVRDAIDAIDEFCMRYQFAWHKIQKSVTGYFRGVCKKYWRKKVQDRKKELILQYGNASTPAEKTRLIQTLVSVLFTRASGLPRDVVDEQKCRILRGLPPLAIIEALYEFCTAAMHREHKIRNMNAYLLNIINRRIKLLRTEAKASGRLGNGVASAPPKNRTAHKNVTQQAPNRSHISHSRTESGSWRRSSASPPDSSNSSSPQNRAYSAPMKSQIQPANIRMSPMSLRPVTIPPIKRCTQDVKLESNEDAKSEGGDTTPHVRRLSGRRDSCVNTPAAKENITMASANNMRRDQDFSYLTLQNEVEAMSDGLDAAIMNEMALRSVSANAYDSDISMFGPSPSPMKGSSLPPSNPRSMNISTTDAAGRPTGDIYRSSSDLDVSQRLRNLFSDNKTFEQRNLSHENRDDMFGDTQFSDNSYSLFRQPPRQYLNRNTTNMDMSENQSFVSRYAKAFTNETQSHQLPINVKKSHPLPKSPHYYGLDDFQMRSLWGETMSFGSVMNSSFQQPEVTTAYE